MFLPSWVIVFSCINVSASKNAFSSSPINKEVATLICSWWLRSFQDAICALSSRLLPVLTTPWSSSVTLTSLWFASWYVLISCAIFSAMFLMILVVIIMSPPYNPLLLLVTCDSSRLIPRITSPSVTLFSSVVSQTERHSLRSGLSLCQKAVSPLARHLQRAKPFAPPGQLWTATSPALVVFHDRFLAITGGHTCLP